MMNRRTFFRHMGLGAATAIVAPMALLPTNYQHAAPVSAARAAELAAMVPDSYPGISFAEATQAVQALTNTINGIGSATYDLAAISDQMFARIRSIETTVANG